MARPKQPVITREDIVSAALKIIDAEGLENLSMRRIGAELDMNAASLYYHFENKEAIVEEVAHFVLRGVRVPSTLPDDWIQAAVDMVEEFRAAMMEHPNVLPLVALRVDRNFTPSGIDYAMTLFKKAGIPAPAIWPLLEAMRALSIGAITLATSNDPATGTSGPRPIGVLDDATRLELWLRALLTGYAQVAPSFVQGHQRRRPTRRSTKVADAV
jgi:AcrR family transcriptional regulator